MYDSAVATSLMETEGALLFEKGNARPGTPDEELAGRGEAHDSGPDYEAIVGGAGRRNGAGDCGCRRLCGQSKDRVRRGGRLTGTGASRPTPVVRTRKA
jgi:hypothetical protein